MIARTKRKNVQLRLISGGQDPTARLRGIHVVVSSGEKKPFPVDARVVEEDTFLVLSEEPTVCEPVESPVHLMTRLIETRPEIPGSVLVRGSGPYKIMAVVHDVNQDPTWREYWVSQALKGAFRAADRRKLKAVALDMLGCMHGRLNPLRFTRLLKRALDAEAPQYLRRIWILPPRGIQEAEIARWIREMA